MNSFMLLQRRMTMLGKKEYIVFVDPVVEQICVSNWSSDGIGLTYKDAARVTGMTNQFQNQSTITSFDELQYFTGMTTFTTYGNTAYGTFRNCTALTSVTLPDTTTSVTCTFAALTNLVSVNVPESLKNVGNGSYQGVPATFTIPTGITSIGPNAFNRSTSNSGSAGGGPQGVLNLPLLTSLGSAAFYACTGLTSIVNLGSLTAIPANGSYQQGTFGSCTNLTDVVLPSSCIAVGAYGFSSCTSLTGITGLTNLQIIRNRAFYDTRIGGELDLTNLTTLESGSFHLTNITGIKSLGSITSIQNGGLYYGQPIAAFSNCTSLTYAKLPQSLTSIGNYTFASDTALTGVTFDSGAPSSAFSYGTGVFCGTTSITKIEIPTGTTSIGSMCFYGQGGQTYNASVAADLDFVVDCPNLTSLGQRSFYRSKVQHIRNLGNSITALPSPSSSQGTFHNCTYLLDVVLPSGVTAIPGYSFYGCTHLQSINLSGITGLIDQSAFYNCYALTGITTSASGISTSSFRNCSAMTEVHLSDNVSTIGGYAFGGTALSFIEIGSGITSIGNNAFQASSSDVKMTVIIRAETVPTLGSTNFVIRLNRKFTDIYVPYSADHSILNAYKTAANWSDFSSTIYELDASGNIPT